MSERREPESLEEGDLAQNIPGSSLRRKSESIRSEFPVRVLVAKVLGVHTSERAWRRGAAGEEEVARRLAKLDSTWRVLHGVEVGPKETDIDHVVIGPGGVFTLNTKNHLGKKVTVYERAVYVSGVQQPYLGKSRAEGRRASKLLSQACGFEVTVSPVIVIMASELRVKGSPNDVNVVARKRLYDWLVRRPTVLSPDQIESVYAVARRPSTWKP